MKIFRISDKTMFNGDYNKFHNYLIYQVNPDKKIKGDKGWRALQLNHLYIIDKKRLQKFKAGSYLKEKFKEYEAPSLIDKNIYTKTAKGTNLNFDKNTTYINAREISKKQKKRILKKIY